MVGEKVFIKTFGCSLNHSDSEVMAGLLSDAGFDVRCTYSGADSRSESPAYPEDVDVVIINSCTVKNLAESKFFKELRYWRDKHVKIIAAGCMPQAEAKLLDSDLKDISVIGTRQITHVVDIVTDTLSDKIVHDLSEEYADRLGLSKVRQNPVIEIIPILEGCTGNCSYCKTKFARGGLKSYLKEDIISQFRDAISDGCKEIWITSQDNGCYGLDIYRDEGYFLPQLLHDLLDIDGDFRIRLGMCNPDHIGRIKDGLAEVFKHPKMFRFLHIPVQSGSGKVLRDMRRSYTIDDFKDIIALFRKEIPDIVISTDIIVGFPGETEEEFKDTLDIVDGSRFDVLNVSRFWPRKGTDAAGLRRLPSDVMVERSKKVKALFDELSLKNNSRFIGSCFNALSDGYTRDGLMVCRTDSYKEVILKDSSGVKLGEFVCVRIVDADRYHLFGELLG